MRNIIEVHNLSKIYRLGEIGTGTISRDIHRWASKMLGKEDPFLKVGESNNHKIKSQNDIVFSLKDINFNIKQGETLGIIGRNGAGKSTLLKILSRVTSPTTGKIQIKGRVASLLEVGTGFHPELTGKENIFLNGAILGMRKREISKKLEEIVDFSGVDRYIDTPVKRYSSGMYVRLAFAVAAHLDSEILIVDEVLAVGDAEFQKKCLGKMSEVSKGQGKTVLFVSHNLSAVRTLCNTGILLHEGNIRIQDQIEKVLNSYNSLSQRENEIDFSKKSRSGIGEIQFTDIEFKTNHVSDIIVSGKDLFIDLSYHSKEIVTNAKYEFVLGVWNVYQKPMFMVTNQYIQKPIFLAEKKGKVRISLPKLPLNSGTFQVNLMIRKNGIDQDFIENACEFVVEEGNYYQTNTYYPENYEGVYLDFDMEIV